MTTLATAAVEAARRNHEEFLAELCRRYPGSAWHTGAEATWYMTGVPAAQFNGVVRVSDREGLEETVGVTVRRFAGRKAPFYWYAGEGAPDGLRTVLEHGSFVARDIDMPVLAAPTAVDDGGSGARVSVELVDSSTALRAWEQAFFAASGLRSGNGQWVDMFQTVGFAPPSPFRLYLAKRGPEAVATGLLFLGTVAGLYALSRVPSARGEGLASAVAAVAMADAAREGRDTVVTHAPAGAAATLGRLGFETIGAVSRYRWTPPEWRPRPRQPQWE